MNQNCKIKDNSLNLQLNTVELNKITKIGRTIVNIKQSLKRAFNVPDRIRIVRLSNHISHLPQKRNLEKGIITEIRTYKGKQTITVKTDINNRFKQPI